MSDLDDYGAAHGLSFTPPAAKRPAGLPADDQALVFRLESELEQARTALSALEAAQATGLLSRIEADLVAHPYLPEATFLMGECLALRAQAAREHDPARALTFEARRQALEGPRAPSFGDVAPEPPSPVRRPREIRGLASPDELEIDGSRVASSERHLELAEGTHHARVFRHGRQIFASFFEIAPLQKELALAVPPLVPCSSDDFDGVVAHQPLPDAIACPHWAFVQPSARGGIDIALCRGSHCERFQHWQRLAPVAFSPIAVQRSRVPAWAGFVLAGAGALLASGVVLWQAGAFERGRPSASTWEYGGLNP